jgi:hypothetical protein
LPSVNCPVARPLEEGAEPGRFDGKLVRKFVSKLV